MSVEKSSSSAAMGVSELKKAVAAKEREVDYKITHFASFADNIEQVCDRDNVCNTEKYSDQQKKIQFEYFFSFFFLLLFRFRQMTLTSSIARTTCEQYATTIDHQYHFSIQLTYRKFKNCSTNCAN
jgi:hypothetical protein